MPQHELIDLRMLADDMEAGTWNLSTALPYQPLKSPATRVWEEEWLAHELANRAQIDQLAKQWSEAGWAEMQSQPEQYWLRLRLVAASRFLAQFALADGSSKFQSTAATRSDLVVWMLVAWWAHIGKAEALYHIIPRPATVSFSEN